MSKQRIEVDIPDGEWCGSLDPTVRRVLKCDMLVDGRTMVDDVCWHPDCERQPVNRVRPKWCIKRHGGGAKP